MIEDKVTAVFLLAPVFFVFVLRHLERPTKANALFVLFCGMGLMFTHPVILFLSCTIAVGLMLFSWLMKKTDWRGALQLLFVIVLVLLPYVVLRLYDRYSQAIPFDAESVSVTFQAERYVNVVNDVFYGLNPNVLKLLDVPFESDFYLTYQIIRLIPVILVLIAAVLSVVRLTSGWLYWYILTCTLLIAFATIPYTGWILGYFISARMISRVSWFSPLGLAGASIVLFLVEWTKTSGVFERFRMSTRTGSKEIEPVTKGLLAGSMFLGIMMVFVVFPRAPMYFDVLDRNRQMVQMGDYIDQNTDAMATVIALDYVDIQMLPSVSAHTSLISFREEKEYNPHNYFLTVEEIKERKSASNIIRSLDQSVSRDERCLLLDAYDVRFVLAGSDNVRQFAQITDVCKRKPIIVFETKDLVLLEYR